MPTELDGVYILIRPTSTQGGVYILGQTACEDCDCAEFDIGNFGGNEVGGTFIGIFDGYMRFESTTRSTGDEALTIITGDENTCCKLVDVVLGANTENIVAYYEIQCGNPFSEDSLESNWVEGACLNYMACQTQSGVSNPAFTIDLLFEQCTGVGGPAVTRYSTDYGATFDTPQEIETTPPMLYGIDTVKVGTAVLAGATGQVMIAHDGSAYSAYGDPLPSGAQPSCIWIPRYVPGTSSTANDGTNPDFVVASGVADGDGETMWIVTDNGTTFTPITPTLAAVPGLAVSANCFSMPYKTGMKLAGVFDFDGETHLMTSTDGGSSWTDRGEIAGATYVRFRRGDISAMQLYIAGEGLIVSPTFGSNLITKSSPTSDALGGIEPFG